MSANIWNEEVAVGLIEEIHKSVFILDDDGNEISLPKESITVRKPEDEFGVEDFPCVSISFLGDDFNSLRYNPNPVIIERDIQNKKAFIEDSAIPFDIQFQIDFWAKYQSDLDYMVKKWKLKHFRSFNLDVVDDGGTKRNSNVELTHSLKRADLIIENKRIFRAIMRYEVWVELDSEDRVEVPIVNTIKVERKIK